MKNRHTGQPDKQTEGFRTYCFKKMNTAGLICQDCIKQLTDTVYTTTKGEPYPEGTPIGWKGSSNLRTLCSAGLITFNTGQLGGQNFLNEPKELLEDKKIKSIKNSLQYFLQKLVLIHLI